MTSIQKELATITERLASIEKQNRCLRAIIGAVVLVLGSAALMAAANLREDELDAKQMILRDAGGNIRYKLAVDADGDVIQTFMDAKNVARATLLVDAKGSVSQSINDTKGKPRQLTHMPSDGNSIGQFLIDENGKYRISTYSGDDGLASIELHDPAGGARVSLVTTAAGTAMVGIKDKEGNFPRGL